MSEYEIKRLRLARITTVAVVALLLVALMAFASLCIVVGRYESRVDQIVTDLETVTAQLGQLDVEHLVTTVNGLSQELEDADIQNIVATLDSLSRQLESIPWSEVADNINGLAVTAQESLGQVEESLGGAMAALNTLDIEGLNKAITDLQTVIEPMAKLAERFG